MRLLFLTPQLPFPPTQGAAIRNSHLIAGLAGRHAVSVLTFAPPEMAPGTWTGAALPALPGLPPLANLTLVPPVRRGPQERLKTLLLTGAPDMARRLASPALTAALARMLRADDYDWVLVEGIEMAPYALPLPAAGGRAPRWLFDEHNAEYLLQQRVFLSDLRAAYRPRAAAGAAYSLVQWRRLRAYERRACRAADAVTAVSAADRDALRQLDPSLDVTVVPNGVDLDEWSAEAAPADPTVERLHAAGPLLVFDGSMDFRPNVDAVRWFCAACWPRIRAAQPTATFAIVGRNPAPAVQALAALPGVRVTGAVPDTRPWVAGADVYVVPMRAGGGVRLKLLQALAMARPLVSTPLGAEGVELQPGRDLLLAATPPDFASAVLALLTNPARRAALGQAARAAAAPYAWDRIVPRLESVLTKAEGSGSRVQGLVSGAQPVDSSREESETDSFTPNLQPPNPPTATPVSLIMTVYNEAESMDALIASLCAQTHPPDEVVIVDGGSTDGTPERIRGAAAGAAWPVRVLIEPGANISAGRNRAIAAAQYPLIAATDAGVRLPPTWLAALLAPFAAADGAGLDVVSGFFAPDPQTVFERAMGATVLPVRDDVTAAGFLPSSRSVAFRKAAWAAAGGYPEWLDYCEDLVFDLKLQERGCRFAFAPEAVALFRPRGSLRAFYQQYYRYARGDGKADLWRRRHAIRYLTYLAAPLLALGARRLPILGLLLAGGAAAYCATPYRRLRPWLAGLSPAQRATAIAWVPVIRLVGDVAKMAGYPVGVWWRLRQPDQAAIAWRIRSTASEADVPR